MDGRNFIRDYEKIIQKEQKVQSNRLYPHRLYRLYNYEYKDGNTETLRGNDATLLFCTGIFEGKMSALKISMIPPDIFFNWFKRLIKNNEILETDETLIRLDKLSPKLDRGGKRLWEGYIQNNVSLKKMGNPYRTYNLNKISYIAEIYLKKQVLVDYYGDN